METYKKEWLANAIDEVEKAERLLDCIIDELSAMGGSREPINRLVDRIHEHNKDIKRYLLGIEATYFIGESPVSESYFRERLQASFNSEYHETEFNSYLDDEYGETQICGRYYEAHEILSEFGHYDDEYDSWLELKKAYVVRELRTGEPLTLDGDEFKTLNDNFRWW